MGLFRVPRPRVVAYFAFELALVVGVILGLAQVTLGIVTEGPERVPVLPVLAITAVFCAALFGTQSVNLGDDAGAVRGVVVLTIVSVALGLLCYATERLFVGNEQTRLAGLLALECAVAVPVVIAGWRWISVRYDIFNALRERVLILGTGETARKVCRWIIADHSRNYGVIGFADRGEDRLGTVLAMGARIQTSHDSLVRFCTPARVDRVIVALDEKRGLLPVRQLMELRLRGIEIEEATSFFERISGKIAVETMLPSWLIYAEGFKSTRLRTVLKRVADIAFSLVLLVVTFPVMLVAGVAIWLDSPGSIHFRQDRLGRDGRSFQLLKFRSMKHGAERESGPTWATKNDPRITRVGRVLRKLRIDELPQMLNVLRGEMSFVGPRPEREHFVRQLETSIPYYGLRMAVRPGITGWAQVRHGYADSAEDALEKLKYDLYYIKNNNLLLDMWIVLMTVRVVLGGRGAH
jgi:sugar transferase (PEP-CTERM system associated)